MKENIVMLRRMLGLTQKEFGFNLGCSRDKIANIELGRVMPDDVFVRHICTVFHVKEEWLRSGQGEMWADAENSAGSLAENYQALPRRTRELVDRILTMSKEDLDKLEKVLEIMFPE